MSLPPQGQPDISVCFCSRGRPDALREATDSLLREAARPDRVEIIVGIDPDDEATAAGSYMHQVRLWTAPERYGYTQLHRYLNQLAAQARGEWCMWFNDDMRMMTPGWDKVITDHRPAILWPYANHVSHANICPAWPRAWAEAMGHVSPSTHMDTFLQRLGEALDRHDRIPVGIVHDRYDVTGGHNDATYAEGRALLGSEGMVPGGWDEALVPPDVEKIRALLGDNA